MRLGVFGGTFDPPHNGHLALCLYAREFLGLDRLIVSLSKNPFKSPSDAPDDDRAAMALLFAAEINSTGAVAEVSGWELGRPAPSYTVDLLRYVGALNPGAELVLLVGEDSYRQMHLWKSSTEIPALCRIAVFGRSGDYSIENDSRDGLPAAQHYEFDMPVSATAVRRLIADGEPVTRFVPPSIAAYIESKRLYR
ncbi:MAG TPA: nicotinate (nicotinamide) nucleotide adenylyltransferase [Chlorobaculum sp.]|nr:nicotinate (nicotinamide) nucleotide adenylyltransferase [Chlorobaculum sp.]